MSSEKPNFLSQPVVKNIFMFRNGDPYYDARRIVINQKRVSNFETLLREVTGGIQAPFGAVRNIYTPRGGHKVDCLESLQSGEQYVAAGKERFKRLDYLQIGSRRKRMMRTLPMQAKPLPPNRIIVSARFLKPIKEPCTIFVVANGDVLNPAMRLLIHQRMLGQFDRILELITEKMGLKVLGGVRSLYTYEGHQVTDGNQLESGQLYVAVGRERFKKLPYSDLLFTKPRGTRRVNGMKAYSLPPIYRLSKQNGNSKSMVRRSESGDGDSEASPPGNSGNNKEHLSSFIREISQTRLTSLRKKMSGQGMALGNSDNDEVDSKADEDKSPQDHPAEEKTADDDTQVAEENGERPGEEEAAAESTTGADTSTSNEEKNEESEGQRSRNGNGDKTQDIIQKEDGNHTSSEGEKDEQDNNIEEEKQDKDSGKGENSSKGQVNDVDTGEEQKETESSDNNQEEEVSETKEGATTESGEEERKVNGEVRGEDGEVESATELDLEEKQSASYSTEAAANGGEGEDDDKDNQDKSS